MPFSSRRRTRARPVLPVAPVTSTGLGIARPSARRAAEGGGPCLAAAIRIHRGDRIPVFAIAPDLAVPALDDRDVTLMDRRTGRNDPALQAHLDAHDVRIEHGVDVVIVEA